MEVRYLGINDYTTIWEQMKEFTIHRSQETADQLWLLQHYPVYTQGQAGKAEHVLNNQTIPIVQSDRGGQVTYHGPGQLVVYVLMDISKRAMGVRTLVSKLEQVLISLLSRYEIIADIRCGAPGVYVGEKKIASIGLRVKNGCTYHGIALNVDMDLKPFLGINPCGFSQMEMTQIRDFSPNILIDDVGQSFVLDFLNHFN